MGNKVGRILIGIAIIAVAFFVIYKILPGRVKYPLQQAIQSKTDDNYATLVDTIKASTVPKNKKVTFGDMVAGMDDKSAWTIEKFSVDKAGNGSYIVYADAYDFTVSFENENNDDGMVTHTDAHVKLSFSVEKNGNEIKMGKKKVEAGEVCYPTAVEIDEYAYHPSDASSYYQEALDCMCGASGAE